MTNRLALSGTVCRAPLRKVSVAMISLTKPQMMLKLGILKSNF